MEFLFGLDNLKRHQASPACCCRWGCLAVLQCAAGTIAAAAAASQASPDLVASCRPTPLPCLPPPLPPIGLRLNQLLSLLWCCAVLHRFEGQCAALWLLRRGAALPARARDSQVGESIARFPEPQQPMLSLCLVWLVRCSCRQQLVLARDTPCPASVIGAAHISTFPAQEHKLAGGDLQSPSQPAPSAAGAQLTAAFRNGVAQTR